MSRRPTAWGVRPDGATPSWVDVVRAEACRTRLVCRVSGPVPPNPSELLTSPRFTALLATCREEYDYVLADTPPLLAVTDPCVVASRVDGLLLTIRLTRKGRPDAERAREILLRLNVKIVGVVVNGITRGTAGIYSPHAYDYIDTYDEDESDGEKQYYYYEEDEPVKKVAAAPHASEPSSPTNGSASQGGKGFWGRWWPGNG